MSVLRLNRPICSKLLTAKCYSTAVQDEEYSATPQYPPILDLSYKKRLERKYEALHERIKAIPTVEEKQIKLNMPKFYGFKCYVLSEHYIPYNSLNLAQHITRTHLITSKDLPDYYKNIDVDQIAKDIRSDIEEAILVEFEGYIKQNGKDKPYKWVEEDRLSSSLCRQITRVVINKLSKQREEINDIQLDYDPRIESTWVVGGINPYKQIQKHKAAIEWRKQYADDPVDRIMVYTCSPSLTLRSKLPLPLIISPNEAENPALEVPFFQYDPRVVGSAMSHRRMVNVPGFWPGDRHRFGLLSIHKRGHLHNRSRYQDPDENKDALHRQAILSSYAWLQAQANLLGFTTYNDVTYPLVSQAVITDGRSWSFYAYQMNTMLVHSKYIDENAKRNVCWNVGELKLFDEIADGRIVNFNEDTLKMLLKFYANRPEERLGVNLTPFLGDETKVAADYEDDDKRQWLEREYKFLVSNRPRHLPFPEVFPWEKIYKVDNKTRFMEKRRTLQDKLIQPQDRTLDDRNPFYIPRKLRPDLPRWKGRYHKEYFP